MGKAELRYNTNCDEESERYYKNKPFVSWTETDKNFRKSGLGTRRLLLMNAISRMFYGLPLHSGMPVSPEAKKIWEKLVKQGDAVKFKEDDVDRYVMAIEK